MGPLLNCSHWQSTENCQKMLNDLWGRVAVSTCQFYSVDNVDNYGGPSRKEPIDLYEQTEKNSYKIALIFMGFIGVAVGFYLLPGVLRQVSWKCSQVYPSSNTATSPQDSRLDRDKMGPSLTKCLLIASLISGGALAVIAGIASPQRFDLEYSQGLCIEACKNVSKTLMGLTNREIRKF